jgi:hypothetical protein
MLSTCVVKFISISLRYGAADPTIIVCANFSDSKSRVVTEKEGRQWCVLL